MGAAATAMAKKSGKAKSSPGPTTRRVVLQMKGTDEWKGWLERLASFLRTPTSTLVDHALVQYAKEKGFDEHPPQR